MKKEFDAPPAPPPRKLRFAPKAPPPKAVKPLVPKNEPADNKEETIDKELLMKLRTAKNNDGLGRRTPKNEKKDVPAKVAFGAGNPLIAKSFPICKSTTGPSSSKSATKVEKEYVEPWDYIHSNYPITLPLRRPYSGDPEILNEEEFGDETTGLFLRGTGLCPADELGLTEKSEVPQTVFFQLPSNLPFSTKRKARASSSSYEIYKSGCCMGKLLVRKSGKVKMKIGDALFDVDPGQECKFAQDVTAISVNKNQLFVMGELNKSAIVTPDVDSMLNTLVHMEMR